MVVLVPDTEGHVDAFWRLFKAGIPPGNISFIVSPLDSIWVRDFGPLSLRKPDGDQFLLDPNAGADSIEWGNDSAVPGAIASRLCRPMVRATIALEGGNFLTNGEGLCVTSTDSLPANMHLGYDIDSLQEELYRLVGCTRLVFLEPLEGEPTGHVDMFVTFPGPDTVVVSSCSKAADPVNSALLDRNAKRLAEVRTTSGRLKVVRIPVPNLEDRVWRTYTNVVYAGGLVLVPQYPGVDPGADAHALTVFAKLIPEWEVFGIDCNELIEWGGALHCATLNLDAPVNLRDRPLVEIQSVHAGR